MSIINRFATKPQLAAFFRSLHPVGREHYLYAHMMREDIVTGLMPIRREVRRHPQFTVELTGSADDTNAAQTVIASFSDRNNRNLTEIVCRAVEAIATALTWDSRSLYQIVTNNSDMTAHPVSPKRTYRLPFYTVQIVPTEERAIWKKRLLHCPNRHIWSVAIPNTLGGPRGFRKMMKQLESIPPGSLPNFVVHDLEESIDHTSFDLAAYSLRQALFINKVTSQWSWHRRDWSNEQQCEYFQTYKRTMFRRSQLILREHLIEELNGLLHMLGLNSTITVRGLPAAADLLHALERLRMGEIQFNEVYDLCGI